VDEIPSRIRAYDDAQWQEAWSYVPKVPRIVRDIEHGARTSPRDSLFRAAYFVAGKLHDDGFSLFQNGGQPLLKRHREEWIDEILFHVPPTAAPYYSPVSVEMMVSFEGLRPIRAKYCRSSTMVPTCVATVNLGAFEMPPCRMLWNVEDQACVEDIARNIHGAAMDWVEALTDPLALEDKVVGRRLDNVDDVTGLELVMALGGRHSAARVIREWKNDPELGPVLARRLRELAGIFGPVYRGDDCEQNIAVMCVCYDLLGPRMGR